MWGKNLNMNYNRTIRKDNRAMTSDKKRKSKEDPSIFQKKIFGDFGGLF
jgi:hypothetical protein